MKRKHKHSKKAGLSPGTLMYLGEKRDAEVKITEIKYSEGTFEENEISAQECKPFAEESGKVWYNVDGIHDTGIIEQIGANFKLHPLVLEDIVNTLQRPKLEDFEEYIYLVLDMIYLGEGNELLAGEQVSVVLGKNYVISFQEKTGDVFEGIRKRLREGKGRMRKTGCDYLAYSLVDAVVDSYFSVLEQVGERLEDAEESIASEPSPEILKTIYGFKRELVFLRKAVWPLREAISNMERSESKLISKSTSAFLRDLYDHTIQVIDTTETYRDMGSGLLDFYLSSVSNRMNEVMKVLTVIATIFIPLTFIAGVYGMNFIHMPELAQPLAYPTVWGVMIIVALGMVLYFRRKKWL